MFLIDENNMLCPNCKAPVDACDNPNVIRTYISKEEQPKPLFVLGHYDKKDDFIPDEKPNLRGVSHDLVDNDICLGCIELAQKENTLCVDLYPQEGSDALPNYAYITISRSFVEQVVLVHRELVLSRMDAGIISTSFAAIQLSNSTERTQVERDHIEFCESEHIHNIQSECRITKGGAIVVSIELQASQFEFYADSAPFEIVSLFEFETTDFIVTENKH